MIKEYLCSLNNDYSCFITTNCRALDLRAFIFLFGFSAIGYLLYVWFEILSKKEYPKIYVFFHSWLFWSTLLICIGGLFIVPKYLNFMEESTLIECSMTRGIGVVVYSKPYTNKCDLLHYCKVRNDAVRNSFIVGVIICLWNAVFPFIKHYVIEESLRKRIFYFNCHALFCFNLLIPIFFLYLSPIG